MNTNIFINNGFKLIEIYYYNNNYSSYVLEFENNCIIIDDNICKNSNHIFNYTKYCDMQNTYMNIYKKLYRFNYIDNEDNLLDKVLKLINKDVIELSCDDNGGRFDVQHFDNSILESEFEKSFVNSYGSDSLQFLKKEYSISLNDGKNAFVDYVVETLNGNFAIEENGVNYHHPCIIGNEKYEKQLDKQNTLVLLNFKVYRFSTQNMMFKDQLIDSIKKYIGSKQNFINNVTIKEDRKFELYEHQEKILEDLISSRKDGINTALIVLPTGTGKSEIIIDDITQLVKQNEISKILVMVPSTAVKIDWEKRVSIFSNLNIDVKFYNTVFLTRNILPSDYYDYIVFDEAHHAQASNCKKTLQYFNPKYLIGLTATPERMDMKKIEEIFGSYDTNLTLQEAIEKNVITNIRCYRLISNVDLSSVRYNGKDYKYADLEKTLIIDSRNELVVKTIKKYFFPRTDFYKQGLIFCVNVNHAIKLSSILNNYGLTAQAVYGGNNKNDDILNDYKNKKIQFLCTCQLISEGWDSPQTEVIVMARPTLSKVLYLQQIGRGVRKYEGKECLYVIDVVDNYEGKLIPWSFNSIFKLSTYSDFKGIKNNNGNYLEILGLNETEISMQEIDIFTFEEKYKDYKSLEQAARELFIGTSTLYKWIKKDHNLANLYLPIGNKIMPYFSKDDIENIRNVKNLGIHDETTILKDFIDFIDENTLTFSYKLIFILTLFKLVNKEGEVDIDILITEYVSFYKKRIEYGLSVDRERCAYDIDYLNDKNRMKKSILDNPFEKFERKRFVYYSKDLNILSINPFLWKSLSKDIIEDIINKEKQFLKDYYKKFGGLIDE